MLRQVQFGALIGKFAGPKRDDYRPTLDAWRGDRRG